MRERLSGCDLSVDPISAAFDVFVAVVFVVHQLIEYTSVESVS